MKKHLEQVGFEKPPWGLKEQGIAPVLLVLIVAAILAGAGYYFYSKKNSGPIESPTPTSSCRPRPACLDAHPACEIPEPIGGWCIKVY